MWVRIMKDEIAVTCFEDVRNLYRDGEDKQGGRKMVIFDIPVSPVLALLTHP